ncbi:hypothetical protein [Streptomyces sp. SYSU K21746]
MLTGEPDAARVGAHLLSCEELETVRMLTGQGMGQECPSACLLVGRPALERTMKLAVLAVLEQRPACAPRCRA